MTWFARLPGAVRGAAWMTLSAASFVAVALGARATSAHLSIVEIMFFRAAIGLALTLPWLVHRGLAAARTQKVRWHVTRSAINGLGMYFWFTGLSMLAIGDAMALQFTQPLFLVLFAALALGERVDARRWLITAAGFGGAMIVIRPGFAEVSPAVLFVLATAALYAANHAMTRPMAATESGAVIVFYMNLIHLPAFLALVPLAWARPTLADAGWLAVVGVCGVTAHIFLARALRVARVSYVAPFEFLKLPMGAAAAYVLFGDVSDAWTWIGAAVIFLCGYWNTRNERAAERARAAAGAGAGGR